MRRTKDVLVLVHRREPVSDQRIGRSRNTVREDHAAQLACARTGVRAGIGILSRQRTKQRRAAYRIELLADRDARRRVEHRTTHAGQVAEALLVEGLRAGQTNIRVGRNAEIIAAPERLDLGQLVAEHVERSAKARRPLVLLREVGIAFNAAIFIAVVADAELQVEAIVEQVPAILQVKRRLLAHERAAVEVGPRADAAGLEAIDAVTGVGGILTRFEIFAIPAQAEMVLAQQIDVKIGIDAIDRALVVTGARRDRGARNTADGLRQTKELGLDDRDRVAAQNIVKTAVVVNAVEARQREPLGELSSVLQDIVLAADFIVLTGNVTAGLVAEGIDPNMVGVDVAAIVPERAFDTVPVDRDRVELQPVERIVRPGREAEATRDAGIFNLVVARSEQRIAEQAILDDRARGVKAGVDALTIIVVILLLQRARSIGERVRRIARQEVRLEADHSAGFEIVRTRLGHRRGHAPEGAAIFRRPAAGLDVEGAVEFERHQTVADHGAEVGGVQTVHIIAVFGDRRAAEADAIRAVAEPGVASIGTGSEQDEAALRSLDRDVLDQLGNVDRQAGRGLTEIVGLDAATGDDDELSTGIAAGGGGGRAGNRGGIGEAVGRARSDRDRRIADDLTIRAANVEGVGAGGQQVEAERTG